MRDVGALNSTAAKRIMPLAAESDISCKTARFEGASLLRCTSYAINRTDEYRFQSQRNTFLVS